MDSNTLITKVKSISTNVGIPELDQLTRELKINTTPVVQLQPTQDLEEPLSLNTRLLNLNKSKTVTLFTCKVIFNSYRENTLNTLLRVGILPNYPELLDNTLELLELFCMFVSKLSNPVDQTYVYTPGMTMKSYKKSLSRYYGQEKTCDKLLKELNINQNLALFTLHYNLLSGSTIINDLEGFKLTAKEASKALVGYCNRDSSTITKESILTQYSLLKDTYQSQIEEAKARVVNTINLQLTEKTRLQNLVNNMRETAVERLNKINNAELLISKLGAEQQKNLLDDLNKLYEQQFILHERLSSQVEVDLFNRSLDTLNLLIKNNSFLGENLNNLNSILSELNVSQNTANLSLIKDILTKLKPLISDSRALQHILLEVQTMLRDY